MIAFACPHCSRRVQAPDGAAGTQGKCPSCGGEIRVPRPEDERGAESANGETPPSAEPVRTERDAGEDGRFREVARGRLRQVFRFLSALQEQRTPIPSDVVEHEWIQWWSALPVHDSVERVQTSDPDMATETSEEDDANTSSAVHAEETSSALLRVRRAVVKAAPAAPPVLTPWLESGWEHCDGPLALKWSADPYPPSVQSTFATWEPMWRAWAEQRRRDEAALRLYESLHQLRGTLEREAGRKELALGDGLLQWDTPGRHVQYPLLTRRVVLTFNAAVPEVVLELGDSEPELTLPLLRSLPGVDGKALERAETHYRELAPEPLGGRTTDEFLKGLVHALSPRGGFLEGERAGASTTDPLISRSPVLFLRDRDSGVAATLNKIVGDLEKRRDLPGFLARIVGVEPPVPPDTHSRTGARTATVEPPIYFAKPANAEQEAIARKLATQEGVLVQGPPGTGKSHTIANLIGHLLAYGKSVLVTAHTTKALRVLREHLPEELRPLCVSTLDDDAASRLQLATAVRAIHERLSRGDAASYDARARALESERTKLLERRERLKRELKDARAAEFLPITTSEGDVLPSQAARRLAADPTGGWIPGPLNVVAPALSDTEVDELYRTNGIVSVGDESELDSLVVDSRELPGPDEFEARVRELRDLETGDRGAADLWSEQSTKGNRSDALDAALARAQTLLGTVANEPQWLRLVRSAGANAGKRDAWLKLVEMLEATEQAASDLHEVVLAHAPALPPGDADEHETTARRVAEHLAAGKGLGFFRLLGKGPWKKFIATARVDDAAPRTREHFLALAQLASFKRTRTELEKRWKRQVEAIGGPAFGPPSDGSGLDLAIAPFGPAIRAGLDWNESALRPLLAELQALGFNWSAFLGRQAPSAGTELDRVLQALGQPLELELVARRRLLRRRDLDAELRRFTERAAAAARSQQPAHITPRIEAALRARDPVLYREAHERLTILLGKRAALVRRRDLLARLDKTAPTWAAAIRARERDHGRDQARGSAARAWSWRQAHDELDRRARLDPAEAQRELDELGERLSSLTTELIDARTWAAQLRRTNLKQRQALQGWCDLRRRIGKGTGKRAKRLEAEARVLLSECRSAVPVWIMPLAQVSRSFDPEKSRFDVVIVDEASQCDSLGLAALYLGEQALVVGDPEQVSPLAVGQQIGAVETLIDEHLSGVPNAALYDGRQSLYELASRAFGGVTCLLEHFRCVPEIIAFSNELAYEGRIRPLRESGRVALKPHVIAHRVESVTAANKVNETEADVIASVLCSACEQPEYAGKSFGVISLVGEDQAITIETLVRQHLPETELSARKILGGNAAHFQGDERDVMFLSMVQVPGDGPLAMLDRAEMKQRFNVAASRARDQLWVVHSLDPGRDLKPGDLRRRLIEFARDPGAASRNLKEVEARADSIFETEVARRLIERGYFVRPQWWVGHYRIDLVVEGRDGKRLAVECDGDRYHPIEALDADLARQAVLERLGWRFARVRGSAFFRDPETALKPVFETIRRLGISTRTAEAPVMTSGVAGDEVMRRLMGRAEEIRHEWAKGRAAREAMTPAQAFSRGVIRSTTSTPARVLEDPRAQAVVETLRSSSEPLGKAELTRRARVNEAEWPAVIGALKKAGLVESSGYARGTVYKLLDREAPQPPDA